MTTPASYLSTKNRPPPLMRVAEAGLLDYDRRRTLRRLIGGDAMPTPAEAVARLSALEAETDGRRRAGAASYSIMRHVDLMVALLGETRLAGA